MLIYEDQENNQIVVDGQKEFCATFCKRWIEDTPSPFMLEGIESMTIQNFHVIGLSGNVVKDTFTFLKWYFAKH